MPKSNYLKQNKLYLTILTITFTLGLLFFAYQKELIILRSPFKAFSKNSKIKQKYFSHKNNKRKIKIFYWDNNKWHHESQNLIWTNSLTKNIKHIVANWLSILNEEQILNYKITVQSALLEKSSENLYLSFDRELFKEEDSTSSKLYIVESLLKTFRDNQIKINKIFFLKHHQVMPDSHLDFNIGWPISGFLKR